MAKIMIVDDDPSVLVVLEWILKKKGHRVLKAQSGEECLSLLRQERPDLILLDIMMPGMDGWEVLAKIKNSVDLRSIPIAMLTVKALDADTLKRKDIQGLVDYILKPFTKESLLSRVEGILDSISKSDHVKRRMLEVDAELAEEYERLERAERLHQNLVLTLKDVLKVHSYSPETLKIRNLIKAEAGLVDLYKGRKREILELILERQKANIRD